MEEEQPVSRVENSVDRKVEEETFSKVEFSLESSKLKRRVEEEVVSKMGKSQESSKFRSSIVPSKPLEVKNSGLTMVKMPDKSAMMNIAMHVEKPVLSMTRVPAE